MPAAKIRSLVEPRIYHRRELVMLLNCGETWLASNLAKLQADGMPPFDPLLNGWDAKAVNLWLDRRRGLVSDQQAASCDFTDAWLKASRNHEAQN